MVGLGNVDNTSDANKPVSTATQSALDLKATTTNVDASLNLKADLASPTFTGTVSGITQSMVGLGNVDNTSDANKPVSTAVQSAIDLKSDITYVDISLNAKPMFSQVDASLNLKANLVSPDLTGTPTAPTASSSTNTTQIATTEFVTSAFNNFKANDVSFNNNVDISGNLVIRGNLSVFQQQSTSIINTSVNNYTVISTQDISLNGNLVVSADVSLNSKLYVNSDASFNGRVDICGNFYAQYPAASIPASSIDLYVDLSVNGLTIGCGTSDISTNSVVGYQTLLSNTTGNNNSAFGFQALNKNTGGNLNSAFGRNALYSNTTGASNNGFGASALYYNTGGSFNSAFGHSALVTNTTGIYNTASGYVAGANNTTGSYNTFLGSATNISPTNATWTGSTAIGANALITASNQITLGTATEVVRVPGKLSIVSDASFNGRVDICGNIFARTATVETNTTQLATTEFVHSLLPAGTVIQSAANNVPSGWLSCDGQSLSVITYAALYNAIGYTYGGSGTNFNLPDMRGRGVIGSGNGSGLTARTLGTTGGTETHTLTVNEMPAHDHGGVTGTSTGLSGTRNVSGNAAGVTVYAANGTISHLTHNHTISSQGGNAPHNNMQPYMVLRYLIKY